MSAPDTTSHAPMLRCRNLIKRFGGLIAVNDVNLEILPGEVVALVGDNGAGKSVLIQMLSGVYRPDGGTIEFDGKPRHFDSPRDARGEGIETIYQDLALCDNLGAADNIFLGREVPRRRFGILPGINLETERAEARRVLDDLQINIKNLDAPVRQLSGGQRQAVAISRAVYWHARLMIMDEPTAALGVPEQRKVISLIAALKERGVTVIVISHNMQDVFEVSERILVMRRGRNVGDLRTSETNANQVIAMMIG